MVLKLAWRNVWRNKTRTLITVGAIFFAVILSTLMSSVKEGVYYNMIDSMVGSYTGYAQIQSTQYNLEPTIDNSVELTDSLIQVLENFRGIAGFAPRIEGFALTASDSLTKGSMIIGIDPTKEKQFSAMHERVIEGTYLDSLDKGALVGEGLANALKVGVGDTIVAIGQGYHGSTAAGKYLIKGLLKFGSPELSKQLIVISMSEASQFFDVQNRYSSLVLLFDDPSQSISIVNKLKSNLPQSITALNWKELIPDVVKMIEADKVEGYIFMFILYMVIAFGIFGTILMMLSERMHEFGIMVAVGMKRIQLAIIVWMEVVIISIVGAFVGMFGAFPICLYFNLYPIMLGGGEMGEIYEEYGMEAVLQFSIDPSIFIQQAIIVTIIACLIAIYPVLVIRNLNAINAMKK